MIAASPPSDDNGSRTFAASLSSSMPPGRKQTPNHLNCRESPVYTNNCSLRSQRVVSRIPAKTPPFHRSLLAYTKNLCHHTKHYPHSCRRYRSLGLLFTLSPQSSPLGSPKHWHLVYLPRHPRPPLPPSAAPSPLLQPNSRLWQLSRLLRYHRLRTVPGL